MRSLIKEIRRPSFVTGQIVRNEEMPNYEVDISYDMPEYYTHVINGAEGSDDAENQTRKYIEDTYPEARNIQVDAVREVHA